MLECQLILDSIFHDLFCNDGTCECVNGCICDLLRNCLRSSSTKQCLAGVPTNCYVQVEFLAKYEKYIHFLIFSIPMVFNILAFILTYCTQIFMIGLLSTHSINFGYYTHVFCFIYLGMHALLCSV